MIIEMYGLILHESNDNVYAQPEIKEELKIKTHYEGLDIAQTSRIHYLKFSLPENELPQLDEILHKKIMHHETAI